MNDPLFLSKLLGLPSIRSAFLSPDGRQIAFGWLRRHANQDVFVVSCDGSAAPVALTHTPQATRLISWAPDSGSVVVAEDDSGNERSRLFRVDLVRPGVLQPLMNGHPTGFVRGGSLSPDGRGLYYGVNLDQNGRTIDSTWIYYQDLLSGRRESLVRLRRPDWVEPILNKQGTHLLFGCKERHPSGRQFHLFDLTTREDREILNFGDTVKVFARWFPDGERILVLADSEADHRPQYTRLGVYHRLGGETIWLIDDPKRGLQGAWVSPDGMVVVHEIRCASNHPSYLDVNSGVECAFPCLPGNLLPLGRTVNGQWAALYYAANRPEELVLLDCNARDEHDLTFLTRVWDFAELKKDTLIQAEDLRWRARDGLEIQGWLYRARRNEKQAVIFVHGGPSMHAENRFNPMVQYLAASGFHVLAVNYRGSTGFGLDFRERIKEDGWGGREQEDIADGARVLIDMGLAEPGRVGVTGTSYGGYSAWHQVTHSPVSLISAAVPICGMTDLVTDYETTRPDLRPMTIEMMGGTPEQIPARYVERSPIHFVDRIQARLLIVQGAQDPNVTPEHVRRVTARLDERAIPYDLLIFEDEGHGILKPDNQTVLFNRMVAFFKDAFVHSGNH